MGASLNAIGPAHTRREADLKRMDEARAYMCGLTVEQLREDSWGRPGG